MGFGFVLERIAKASEGFVTGSQSPGDAKDTDDFRITRLDLENGPEVIRIERK